MATIAAASQILVIMRLEDRISHGLRGINSRMGLFASSLHRIGVGTIIAGAAIATGLGLSVKAAIDFETAFIGVIKTVDATDEEMAILKQGIRDMAKELPFTTTEIARIAEIAGQLGIKVPFLLSFTEVMLALGAATVLSAEEAAMWSAKFANITQMPQEDFERLGSTIVALGNNFATTEDQILEMGVRIAGAGQIVEELDLDDIRLRDALLRLATGGDILRRSVELANVAWYENTALAKEAGRRYASAASQFKILRNII